MMSIEGVWYNELDSMMELTVQGPAICGKYTTKVGDANGWYEIVGWVGGKQPDRATLGFVVLWANDRISTDSVTVWTGEWFIDASTGDERLEMMWLLTQETTLVDEWAATKIGKDLFYRSPAPNKTKQTSVKLMALSHPRSAVS
jgi:avidin family protein